MDRKCIDGTYTDREARALARMIRDAAEAEELFGIDELEWCAREGRQRKANPAGELT